MATQGGLLGILASMTYEFQIHKAKDNGYFFTYRNTQGNTEPICWSETYTTKQSCRDAIQKVKDGAATAQIIDRAQ